MNKILVCSNSYKLKMHLHNLYFPIQEYYWPFCNLYIERSLAHVIITNTKGLRNKIVHLFEETFITLERGADSQ